QVNPETGQSKVEEAKSAMFPKEYDPLVVMQAIRIALQTRNRSADREVSNGFLVGEGYAPLIDERSTMKIRLVLDPKTEKVIAAYPTGRYKGIMKLSEIAIQKLERGESI